MSNSDDFPTLVSSLQASTIEWNLLGNSFRPSGTGVFSGTNLRSKYLRFMQVLHEIEALFSIYSLSPSPVLIAWCASLQDSGVAPHFVGLLVDLTLQGNMPYLALGRCLRLIDVFLNWATQRNAGDIQNSEVVHSNNGNSGLSCPVLIPSYTLVKWIEQTWTVIQNLARDNAGTSTPTATAGLCGALQLLPVLLRWNSGGSPLPPFRRGQLPHPVNMQSEEVRLLAFRALPFIIRYQPNTVSPQSYSHEVVEYLRRGCVKCENMCVRIAAGSALRGAFENGLRVSSPAVAYGLIDMLLHLCDDVAPFDVSDEALHDVGVAMGYLLTFYQSDFTADTLQGVLQAATPQSKAAAAAEERAEARSAGGSGGAGAAALAVAARLRWKYFGGSNAVEGSRLVQRCFNELMTRTAQRALATALATLCSFCSTPSTTASVIQCCFVLLMPIEGDGRAYMPRLLADAIQEWAMQLPSNGYRVVLADVLRGYVQNSSEDKTVVRTAMVALQGVVRTLSSSLEIGFNVAEDVLAAVNATPSLLHTGVEVLGAVARTNTLFARQLQHQCARADSADVSNTLSFQLHIRALLNASAVATEGVDRIRTIDSQKAVTQCPATNVDDTLGEEDRVSLVHICIRLLLRLSRGDPPRAVQDVHYRQAELIFRLTQLIYDLLHGSSAAVLHAVRDELQPCTLGFMNLLVSSPAPTIAFYKAVTAACAMLRRAPVVSDTERMLAVGFLESRLASHDGVPLYNVDATASSATTAHFAVSKGALYHLVASSPWPTCRDDGSLRWLAAQALKDVARACARAMPVFAFSDIHGPEVTAAARSMKLVRNSLLQPYANASTVSAAAETTAHPLEECGGQAVRLLRWTLRHFVARKAVPVCVALLASLHTDLYKEYATTVNLATTAEEQAQQAARREMSLWNVLCTVHELLLEASTQSAAALWADVNWTAEVRQWQVVATHLVHAAAQEAVEVRLLAARVLALSHVLTGQVDAFTSRIVASVGQNAQGMILSMDSLGALMVLCEAHSHTGEMSTSAAAAAGDAVSSPTLPLATSLLAEAWRRLVCSMPAPGTPSAAFTAPVLTLLSLRLAQVYPAEVEVALADSVADLLLTPMTNFNTQWWSSTTAMGMLTAIVQLWSAFAGVNNSVVAVPQTSALQLVQESLFASTQSQQTSIVTITAALRAVGAFTQHQERSEERGVVWRRLLHLCLEHRTRIQRDEECVPCPLVQLKGRNSVRRLVVQSDDVSLQLADLWYRVLLGSRGASPLEASAVGDAGGVHRLTVVDVAIQTDLATAAAVRRGWVQVAQAMCTSFLPHSSRKNRKKWNQSHMNNSKSAHGRCLGSSSTSLLTPAFHSFLETVHAILQSRSPDVQVDIEKRDAHMLAAVENDGVASGEDASDDVRGGGGGSDSDNVDNYVEEFGGEGTGSILSKAAGNAGRGGNGPTSSATDSGFLTATSLTFDVAAKEAAMWVLYGVVRAVGDEFVRGNPSEQQPQQEQDEARRAVLPMVVAAAQLVEVHPEVHIATTAVLHEVFALWGDVTQVQELARPLAVLMPWKTQLVVSLTTVLQHGLLSLESCTALAVQYSRCNLADISSCRRVLRSLLLLLHACHRLQERRRGFLLGGSGSRAGHIIVAIAKVAQSPAMAAGTFETAQGAFARTLISAPCQAALTLLCGRFVTAVSLANGYVPPNSVFGDGWHGDEDGEGEGAAAASVYGTCMSVTAGDVLQAVAYITGEPLNATMGPALRYATGCLACLVFFALIHREPEIETESNNDSNEINGGVNPMQFVVALSSKLTSQHQRLLAQLAQQRLLSIVSSWNQGNDAGHTECDNKATKVNIAVKWAECTALLRIAAAASMPRAQAEELLNAFTTYAATADMKCAEGLWAEVAASLLCIGMAANLVLNSLLPLWVALPTDALTDVVSPSTTLRLQQLTAVYVRVTGTQREKQETINSLTRALALTGPAGLMHVCRCVSMELLPPTCSPFLDPQLWPAVLQLLRRAADPVKIIEYIWASSSTAEKQHSVSSLSECVEHHKSELAVLLSLFASIDSPSAAEPSSSPLSSSTPALSLKEDATFVLHCGPLLCGLLVSKLKHPDTTAAAADSLYEVLLYVVTLLSTKLARAYAVALNEVGRYLVRTVAPVQGAALREAIHRLGAAKASQLRTFMEASFN